MSIQPSPRALIRAPTAQTGALAAPFPWFGGKSGAAELVWQAFGAVANYVEPFCGSAAMLLGAPDGKRTCTINDADGHVANFWRAIIADPEEVARLANWPVNEVDLFARHSWLVRQSAALLDKLHGDPDYYDAKIAAYWCWGACAWIGSGWCGGQGPWVHDGQTIVDARTRIDVERKNGVSNQLPHLGNAGKGINRQLPHLGDAGKGINRKLPHLGNTGQGINRAADCERGEFITAWFAALQKKLRDTRVACGDWRRVLGDSVMRRGITSVFFDPPYAKGAMDYAAKGVGGTMADDVREWCAARGDNPKIRIVLCGHAGEHDALLDLGWSRRAWKANGGYAKTAQAKANSASEMIWCSPHCVPDYPQGLL